MADLVISLLNTPAGRYTWYEDFPRLISERLAPHGIDHVVGYKEYSPNTRIPESERLQLHDVHDATDAARLIATLSPIMDSYHRVILHTHSYMFDTSRFRALVGRHPDAVWWATLHRTLGAGAGWKRVARKLRSLIHSPYPDRLYGCSETAAAAARNHFPAERVKSLVNGRLDRTALARFDTRQQPRTAILVGRMVLTKGILEAVQATRLVLDKFPAFRLIVVGDGPDLEAMRTLSVTLNVDHAVEFAGYQQKLDEWYSRADMVWIPTLPERLLEGLGLVSLEAQGHALPAIYSASGGLPETQVNGETGILVDPLDPAGIAAATLRLVDNPAEYHGMRDSIVRHREWWGIERMVDDYVGEYLAHLKSPAELIA